ncbi:hypothetical protein [Haladaptatus caseinilyticus]|uniref:hypothetical protein n=1 Tax=Haladaptatus caseinilyticus TaxID=2993314 RepID=UPI00224A82D0|nr:hypothetical protein [Haladaptatus caseinilyticus]
MSNTDGGFRDHLCTYIGAIHILFMVCSLVLVLNLVSFVVVPRRSATFVIIVLNFVALVPISLAAGYMVLYCRNVPL